MEAAYLELVDAKNDPMSYNMHNGDGKMNSKKVGELAAVTNKANSTAVYKSGFYESKEFLEGSKVGGKMASNYIREVEKGIFKKGYFESEDFKKMCSETGRKNAINKKGVMGRSKEQMKKDNTKAALTLFMCPVCGVHMNAGNLARHKKARHS